MRTPLHSLLLVSLWPALACGPVEFEAPNTFDVHTQSHEIYIDPLPQNCAPGTANCGSTRWNRTVDTCWNAPGDLTEKAWAQSAVDRTWNAMTWLDFTWREGCPSGAWLKIDTTAGVSNSLWGMDGTLTAGSPNTRIDLPNAGRRRSEYVGTHEIGHALGLHHEHIRRGENIGGRRCDHASASRTNGVINTVNWGLAVTPYDQHSTMNYCSGNQGFLTRWDVDGIRTLYGWPGSAIDATVPQDIDAPWKADWTGVYQWTGNEWALMRSGVFKAVDVRADGKEAWAVNLYGQIHHYNNNGWSIHWSNSALDIGSSGSGNTWMVQAGTGALWRWNGTSFQHVGGSGFKAVDVAPNNNAWAVDTTGRVYEVTPSGALTFRGAGFRDVGVGYDGMVWAVDTLGGIKFFLFGVWTDHNRPNLGIGPQERIAGGANKQFIHVGQDGRVRTFVTYTEPGAAKDIGVGPDTQQRWIVDPSGRVKKFTGNGYTTKHGGTGHIAVDVDPDGNAWAIHSSGTIRQYDGTNWTNRPGGALDVGVGADGSAWVIGRGSKRAFEWSGTAWIDREGGPFRAIDVAPDGHAWAILEDGTIQEHLNGTWEPRSGSAIDIGIGFDGTVNVVGASGEISYWVPDSTEFRFSTAVSEGGQLRVSGGPHAEVAAVSTSHQVRIRAYPRDGKLVDIALSPDETEGAYAIGTSGRIFQWASSSSSWDEVDAGTFEAIAAGPNNRLWAISTTGSISERIGGTVFPRPGGGRDIGIGLNGATWVVGRGSRDLFRWTGNSWMSIEQGTFDRVDVAPDGSAWVTDSNRKLYRHSGGQLIDEGLDEVDDVAVSASGRVFALRGGWTYTKDGSDWKRVSKHNPFGNRISAGTSGEVGVVNESGVVQIRSTPIGH